MNSSSLIKVLAAFVTGVLVALGGTLLYVKATDRTPSQPIAAAPAVQQQPSQTSAMQQTPSPAPASETPEPATEPQTAPEPEPSAAPKAPARHRHALQSIGHKFSHNGDHARPAQQTELAQATAAPQNPYSATAPPQSSPAAAPVESQPARPAVQDPASVTAPAPSAATAAATPQPQTVTLDPGTSIVIRLGESLSSEHNQSGDSFRGTLELPIIRNGFIIADKGSPVKGKIVNAQRAGRGEGASDMGLALTEINTTDGQRIAVQTSNYDQHGATRTKSNIEKIGGGAALGAIIGAIAGGGKGAGIGAGVGGAAGAGDVLLTRGKPTLIPSETQLTFRLTTPVTITERLN
ncbi:MAG: hypothetical protein JO061_14330 [Acidobacteriaceae bacterium]|nr:hypothetical protein [Acidobacteriaceae bacterium]